MTKIKIFLIIFSWQLIGFAATLAISMPSGDFHHFVHELILCLTFTNLMGLSGLLLYGLYTRWLNKCTLSKFFQMSILFLLFGMAVIIALNISMNLGKFICGLDQYQVDRWHLSILVVNFTLMVVLSIVAVLLSLYERLAFRLETKIRENEKLQRLHLESKLSLLQSKINPHFLFNTLNTMLDVLRREPVKVEKLILNLSDIYRKTLMLPDNTLVPIGEEITLVEEYLEIEKVRMGDRLRFSFQVDDRLDGFKLPPMMIQILVENAVKHGLTPKKEGGEVNIRASRQGEMVMLEVEDSGVGMDASRVNTGFGLVSIEQRLKLMYDNAKMEILGLTSGGTKIRIVLPHAA